jgi:hypothetical protein
VEAGGAEAQRVGRWRGAAVQAGVRRGGALPGYYSASDQHLHFSMLIKFFPLKDKKHFPKTTTNLSLHHKV